MAKLVLSTHFTATPETVFAFHADASNLPRLAQLPGAFRLVQAPRPTQQGDLQIFTFGGPLKRRWHARIVALDPGHSLTDVQEIGPLHAWRHSHVVWPDGEGALLLDHVEFSSGTSWLSRLFDALILAPVLRAGFRYRHRMTHRFLRA